MNATLSRATVFAVLAAQLAACGGSGTATQSASSFLPSAIRAPHTTKVTLRLNVRRHRRHRRGHYISPSMQSFVYAITGPSPATTAIYGGSVNITPGSPACTQAGALQPLVCSEALNLRLPSSGTYTISAATYDAPQSCAASTICSNPTGNELSHQMVSQELAIGRTNTVALTLGGDVAGMLVTALPTGGATANFLRGDAAGLTLWGPSTQRIAVEAIDADGNPVIGPGAPSIAVTSANTGQLSVAAVTGMPAVFSIDAVTSGSPAVVQPGSVNLSVKLTAPASGGGSLPAVNPLLVPVNIQHAAVWVNGNNTEVLGFFDGNASPSITLSGSNTTFSHLQAIAADANGNVYVTDGANQTLLEFGPGSNGNVAPTRTRPLIPAGHIASFQMAATDDGFLVDGGQDSSSGYVGLYNTNWVTSPEDNSDSDPVHGVTLGRCGDIIRLRSVGATIGAPLLALGGPCTTPVSVTEFSLSPAIGASDYGIAVDNNYDFFISATHSNTIYEYATDKTTQLAAIAGSNTGLSSPAGIVLDAAGSMWVANTGSTTVTAYAAGSTGNASPIVTLNAGTTPVLIAVQPQNIHL